MNKKILVGKVVSAFGIKGEIKIISYCEEPLKIKNYPLFDRDGNSLHLTISDKKDSGKEIIIAKIVGINDRNAAEKIRGKEIFTNRESFSELAENEFYYVDLIGLTVIDEKKQKIGKVTNVYNHGAGGVIEIEFDKKEPAKNYQKIENFSFKSEIFPEVNLKAGFIRITFPEIVEVKP